MIFTKKLKNDNPCLPSKMKRHSLHSARSVYLPSLSILIYLLYLVEVCFSCTSTSLYMCIPYTVLCTTHCHTNHLLYSDIPIQYNTDHTQKIPTHLPIHVFGWQFIVFYAARLTFELLALNGFSYTFHIYTHTYTNARARTWSTFSSTTQQQCAHKSQQVSTGIVHSPLVSSLCLLSRCSPINFANEKTISTHLLILSSVDWVSVQRQRSF